MTEEQATYAAAATTEQVTCKAIGTGVFAFRGDEHPSLICECFTSKWLGITYSKACNTAERIAKMMNGQAI
jgi:hypothetical protein